MHREQLRTLAITGLVLGVAPLVLAHSEDGGHTDEDSMLRASEGAAKVALEEWPESYFRHPARSGLMMAHIVLMVVGWFVVAPLACVLSAAKSHYTILTQVSFLLVNALGVLVSIIYNHQTPDLYANNSHHKAGWAITWIALAWVLMGIVNMYTGVYKTGANRQPISVSAMTRYERVQEEQNSNPRRWSGDSGQGTERNSGSLFIHSRSPSVQSDNLQLHDLWLTHNNGDEDEDGYEVGDEKCGMLRNTHIDRFFLRNIHRIGSRTAKSLRVLHLVMERTMLVLGFVALASGGVVYAGIFHDSKIFGGMAHFVKGGIFFWYGLLTFGRWLGCFADFGWAWNRKPSKELVGGLRASVPTAEFVESTVIAVYGASNVFMEHMAAWGEAWSAQDLEHISITVMFLGGGLLGMLVDSKRIRKLLNATITAYKHEAAETIDADDTWETWKEPHQYRFPMNPLPGLVILLLGIMMSSHHQASMTSTMIHKQWGTMFIGFAMARAVTYIILYISPPQSLLPSRPPSEIISSFCLTAGGIIFMLSAHDIVVALEYNGLEAMFVFTVTMGLTCLVLAWTTVLMAVKGWATRKEHAADSSVKHSPA